MSSRETASITIGEHTFTHYTYATAREMNAIQKSLFVGAKVEIVGEVPKINDFDPTVQYRAQVALVEQLVVAMDDITDRKQIVEACQDLPDNVFQELATHLDTIATKKN